MSKISILMMSDTGGKLNVTGEKVRADGYYGFQDGLHTISIQVVRLIGRIFIEASLSNNPNEEDWFPINLGGENTYIQFPLSYDPTIKSEAPVNGGETGIYSFNLIGNFIWLRARLNRDYIKTDSDDYEGIVDLGSVSRILLNH